MALVLQQAFAFPVEGVNAPLPVGTGLDDDALEQPLSSFTEAIEGRNHIW
jgi:hypothetical protein